MKRLADYLHQKHIPATITRNGSSFVLQLASKYQRKRIILAGSFYENGDGWRLELRIGSNFDLSALLQTINSLTGEPAISAEVRDLQLCL